ncbi:MAG: carboxypeptidase-like regulatory domain-containing protein, partial [Terriglobales bacterium]
MPSHSQSYYSGALSVFSCAPCIVFRILSVLTLVFLGLSLSAGQEQPKTTTDKASLSGKVTDQTGTVVRDAKAVLTSAMGARLAIPVNDKGVYVISELYPGTYTFTVSAPNFADVVFDNLNLTPGKKLTLDATLKPASGKSVVEAGGAEQVEQSTAPATKKIAGDKTAVSGTVTDQSQAVVTGAKALLTNAAGEKVETQVNDKGTYSFTGLKPGTYTLTVTAPNFADKTFDNIALTAGLELTLDASMEPAHAKTEVNVESGGVGT